MSTALAFKERTEGVLPTRNDRELAKESSQQLAHLLDGLRPRDGKTARTSEPVKIEIRLDGEKEIVALPSSALEFLNQILAQMAEGKAISILPHNHELTTMEAAEILNVSRPFLIGLLEKHQLPYRKVGTHRRVRLDDVMRFKQDIDEKRLNALRELSELSEELDMDD
jgi:excisionase family DNA binding protein